MSDSGPQPTDPRHSSSKHAAEAVMRKLLMFLIVSMLPVIGLLVYLNWQRSVTAPQVTAPTTTTESNTETPAAQTSIP